MSYILANAGTPLMWASGLHLLFGNLLIGLFEGSLLKRIYKTPSKRYLLVMVVANYMSCIVGAICVDFLGMPINEYLTRLNPLQSGWRLILLGAIGSYIASILIEWPFCAWTLRKVTQPRHAGLRGSIIAQTTSYAILVPLFALCSTASIYTTGNIQSDLAFVKPPIGVMYYINPNDGTVWRMNTDGSKASRFLDTQLTHPYARLFAKQDHGADSLFDLWCVTGVDKDQPRKLADRIGTIVAPRPIEEMEQEPDSWMNHGLWGRCLDQTRIPADVNHDWMAKPGFWATHGLCVFQKDQYEYRLALEAQAIHWYCRNVINLSNDQAICQFNDMIVIVDLPTRKLACLTCGRGPVVVLPGDFKPRAHAALIR